jgi:predicted NBD/HSP70 family sugar kinase
MAPQPSAPGTAPGISSLGRALALVHTGQVARRKDLTEQLGLTRTATGAVLRELEQLGLVRSARSPAGAGAPTGRPSHIVEIHPGAPAALAVQVQAETLLIAEVALGGTLGPLTELPLPRPATPQAVLTLAADHLTTGLQTATRPCAGIGVAVPSAVADDGTALIALHLSWPSAVPVGPVLRRLLADRGHLVPVQVGNDANLAALAEHRHGAGRGATDLLYLMTGQRGVGGGLVVRGRLHTGSAGYALEVGHLTVRPGGRPCHCGNDGCLEVETDPAALLDAAGVSRTGPALTAARAVITAAATDPRARAAVHAVTERLATGLASLVNVLNPDRIVLAGLHADLLTADEQHLRTALARRSFLDQAAHVDLQPGGLPRPSLAGAAELALQRLLDNPRQPSQSSRETTTARVS